MKFVKFDIQNFYPSITEDLLDKALSLASKYCDISEDDITIIKACRKTALFHENEVWIKIDNFDVTQGS